MSAWDYTVRRLVTKGESDSDAELVGALQAAGLEGWELVSCFPQEHNSGAGPMHELQREEAGSNPDDPWQAPIGPTYVAVFKRPV